jgi:hypothetical protein
MTYCPHYKGDNSCALDWEITCNTYAIYDDSCLTWALNRIKELEEKKV